jgi:hypothetical protein
MLVVAGVRAAWLLEAGVAGETFGWDGTGMPPRTLLK